MEKYYLMTSSEDGDIRIKEMSKNEVEKMLSDLAEDGEDAEFMSKIENNDPMYWGDGRLLIKGNIVTPKAVQVVKKFEIE